MPRNTGESVEGHKVDDYDKVKMPGDYLFARPQETDKPQGLHYLCPCGCNRQGYLPFRGEQYSNENHPSWIFDGNLELPTLTPSINSPKENGGCGWHGYLTKGVWISV